MSSDWFSTPNKNNAEAESIPELRTSTSAPAVHQGRTEAEQAKMREERKRNKKNRKAEQQMFNRMVQDGLPKINTQPPRKAGASTAAQGRIRQKEAQAREKENLRNMRAGLNLSLSSESIEYTAFSQILSENFHGIHKNIIGVIAGVTKKGRSKSGDSYLNMIICDPSAPDSSKALHLNLFAKSEEDLPKAQPSSVILVRHTFLQRFSNRIQVAGRKGDYNWALFNPETRSIATSTQLQPPLGTEEAIYLDSISKWWKIINPDVIVPAKGNSRQTITISQVEERVFCNIIAEVLFVDDVPPPGALELCVTDYTQNSKLKEAWHGLHGHRVIKLSLYDQQRVAGKVVSSGNFILCNNVRPKMNPAILEGKMGSDFGKINIHKLPESDERLVPLLQRKQEFDHHYGLPVYMNTQSTHPPTSSIPESTPTMMSSSMETPSKLRELREQEVDSVASPSSTPINKLPTPEGKTRLNLNHDTTVVPISLIKSISKSAQKYHIKVRIIDFSPQIADWAIAKCTNCDVELDTNDLVCEQCDQDAYVTYKYLFALLLEDDNGDILPAFCCDEDAVAFFDGLSAQEARTEKGLLKMKKKLSRVLGHLIDAEDPEQVTAPDEFNDILIFSYKPVLYNNQIAYRVFCTTLL